MKSPMLLVGLLATCCSSCDLSLGILSSAVNIDTQPATRTDPDVQRILDAWKLQRAKSASVYVEFRRNTIDRGFATNRTVVGKLMYSLPNTCRIDFGESESQVWTATGEFWYLDAKQKRASVQSINGSHLSNYMTGTQFLWLTPGQTESLFDEFSISIIRETDNSVQLRIDRDEHALRRWFDSMIVELDKPSMLPRKLTVHERPDVDVTWEFTKVVENLKLADEVMNPTLLTKEWKISRLNIPAALAGN